MQVSGNYDGGAQINWGGLCCTRPMTAPQSLSPMKNKSCTSHTCIRKLNKRLLMPC